MQNDNLKFKIEFEERLIHFSIDVIKFCNQLRKDRNLWSIADQLIRSATSIGANVFEAKASSSKRDYLRFFEIALKSANEAYYWLILCKKYSKNYENQADKLIQETSEIAKIIGAGVLTMKGKR